MVAFGNQRFAGFAQFTRSEGFAPMTNGRIGGPASGPICAAHKLSHADCAMHNAARDAWGRRNLTQALANNPSWPKFPKYATVEADAVALESVDKRVAKVIHGNAMYRYWRWAPWKPEKRVPRQSRASERVQAERNAIQTDRARQMATINQSERDDSAKNRRAGRCP
jgi:hypothetical protein